MKPILALILAVALFSFCAQADTHVPAGPVSGTWTLTGSPYLIEGNIIINMTSSLTIEPGVQVIMNPGCRFRIEGQLQAIGTQADSIRFLAANTAIGSEGLHFLNTDLSSQDSSRLVYCVISYGVATPSPDPYMHGGGVYIKNSQRLRISHCYVHHCRTVDVVGANGYNGSYGPDPGGPGGSVTSGHGGAIYCENSNALFAFNKFCNNVTGNATGGNGGNGGSSWTEWEPAYGGPGGSGGEGESGNGAAIYLFQSAAVIAGNIFTQNFTGEARGGNGGHGGGAYSMEGSGAYGGIGGGGGSGISGSSGAICAANSQAIINDNMIYANHIGTATGGNGGQGGPAFLGSPGQGGGGGSGYAGNGTAIYCVNSNMLWISNCTITAHNPVGLGVGGSGGLNGYGSGFGPPGTGYSGDGPISGVPLTIVNSIVWDNGGTSVPPQDSVIYSCIQGGFSGQGNISLNPLFVSAPLQNFCLSQISAGQPVNSPCVDAGNPTSLMIVGTTRTDGVQDNGIVDMGYHYPLATGQSTIVLDLTPHHPPIEIPPGGGNFIFDVMIAASALYSGRVDFWTVITPPSGQPFPVFSRNNLHLDNGDTLFRPNLTQFIPAAAPPGSYQYAGYLRDHATWQILSGDSFVFEKLPGVDSPRHNLGWSVLGWDQDIIGTPELAELSLLEAYPNPFNPTTVIRYQMQDARQVNLRIYDTAGRLIATLVNGWREAGMHEVTFDGSLWPSGVYFLRLESSQGVNVQKALLLK